MFSDPTARLRLLCQNVTFFRGDRANLNKSPQNPPDGNAFPSWEGLGVGYASCLFLCVLCASVVTLLPLPLKRLNPSLHLILGPDSMLPIGVILNQLANSGFILRLIDAKKLGCYPPSAQG